MSEYSFVIASDAHIHPFSSPTKNGGLDRMNDGLEALEFTLVQAKTRSVPWVFLGDMKHVRGVWNQKVLHSVLQLFEKYSAVRKIILAGNHDGAGMKETAESGLSVFDPYALVVSNPDTEWTMDGLPPCAFWPWQPNLDALPEFLKECKKKKLRMIFGHAFIRGSKIGPSNTMLESEGVPQETFGLVGSHKERVFDLGFFGDVHKCQHLGDRKQTRAAFVIVPGNPYAQNWGELERDKGCSLVSVSCESNVARLLKWEKLVNIKSPSFVIVDCSSSKLTSFPEELLDDNIRGNFVHLKISERNHQFLVERFGEQFSKAVITTRDFRVSHTHTHKKRVQENTMATSMSTDAMVESYAKRHAPSKLRKMYEMVGKKFLESDS